MFLDRITVARLAKMLEPHMNRPAWPGLDDPAVRKRSAEWAKRLGLWDRLSKRLDPAAPIPVIRRSDHRHFRRTGIRRRGEGAYRERVGRTADAALALWLGHPSGDVDHLQDLLWAWCETTTWIWPAHEGRTVDLGSSAVGRTLAEIVRMFEDDFEDEVKERVRAEVDRRILDGACDWRRPDGWQTVEMNWNHVCNANVITAALYRISDARVLAAYIHPLIRRLEYAIHGFADDGGCREGPGYWNYGFGHFLDAAVVLHHRTGGDLDLVRAEKAREKIERVARYPLAAHIEGDYCATFADSSHRPMGAENALKINRFLDVPELFSISTRTKDGLLNVADWRGLSLFDGQKAAGPAEARDHLLPDLGFVKLRAGKRDSAVTLAALAGSNDVPHNHNDIGSFIYFAKGRPLLTDPGAPEYTRKTFSPRRYEILFCRSRGHSVPVVNGKEQSTGSDRRGTLHVTGLDTEGEKRVTIDMTRAYDDGTLTSLLREFRLRPDGGLALTDTYEFAQPPKSLEEAFITYEEATCLEDGGAVRIESEGGGATISAKGAPGAFAVERLVEESKEGRTDGVVSRITFTPARLETSISLAFEVR